MIKHIFLFAIFGVFSLNINAQIANDVVVYSEDGTKFKLMMFGKFVQEEFSSNINLKDLQVDQTKVQIVFEDPNIPQMNKTLYLVEAGTGKKPPTSSVYKLKKNKKDEWKLRLESQTPKKIQSDQIIIINTN